MEKKTSNMMMKMAMMASIGMAGYMYMKKNPNAMNKMTEKAKCIAKDTYNKLEDIA